MVESTLAFDEIFYTSEPGVSKVKIEFKTENFMFFLLFWFRRQRVN